MPINRLKLQNFKSFSDIDIRFDRFTVLIGANASGKSNLIQAFKFLRDIASHGLANAISMQGGVEYLTNFSIGSSKYVKLKLYWDTPFMFPAGIKYDESSSEADLVMAHTQRGVYEVVITTGKPGKKAVRAKDRLTLDCKFEVSEIRKEKLKRTELGEGSFTAYTLFSKPGVRIKKNLPREMPKERKRQIEEWYKMIEMGEKPILGTLILEQPGLSSLPRFSEFLSNLSVYDVDPRLAKRATQITGKVELEEDGSNLAVVLKSIRDSQDKKLIFRNIMSNLLPFTRDFKVEEYADKSILFSLREAYSGIRFVPASFISDGTTNMAALVAIVYFEKKPLVIIEEPERNIHPRLISKVVSMLKEASKGKQIVLTTHNPEMVRYAGIEKLLLVSRDKNGFSTVSKPKNKRQVKMFLKNDIGIEELYVQDLLGQ